MGLCIFPHAGMGPHIREDVKEYVGMIYIEYPNSINLSF